MATTAGDRATWVVLGALGLAAVMQQIACGVEPVDPTGGAELQAVLAAVGPSVVEPSLAEALTEAQDLAAATEAWASSEATDEGAEGAHEAAVQAWWSTMQAWQRAELHQIGPAAPSATAVGGQDLRDAIYSWPTINPCRVDQESVRGDFSNEGYFETALVNVRGLDALEHLLFAGPDNACPPQVDLNADGLWQELGPEGVRQQRAEHAAVLAAQLVRDIQQLQAAWAPDGQDFGGQLARAGQDGSPYTSGQQALNAIYDALFYLETRTKDRKLALPLGLRDCTGEGCAEQVEGLASGGGLDWVVANIMGFEELFEGGDGQGMADLLASVGQDALVERVRANAQAAIAEAERHDAPLDELVRQDPASAQAVHDALKLLTDDLKGDVATALALQIPSEAAGDND